MVVTKRARAARIWAAVWRCGALLAVSIALPNEWSLWARLPLSMLLGVLMPLWAESTRARF